MKKIRKPAIAIATLIVPGMIIMSCNTGNKSADQSTEDESSEAKSEVVAPNTLSTEEAEQGFYLLFDGKDTKGWRGYGKEEMPCAWVVVDGALH